MVGKSRLLPQKLDVESLAKQLEEELAGGTSVRWLEPSGRKSMKRSRSTTQTFLLDTNVLIAAVKNPTRRKAALKAEK